MSGERRGLLGKPGGHGRGCALCTPVPSRSLSPLCLSTPDLVCACRPPLSLPAGSPSPSPPSPADRAVSLSLSLCPSFHGFFAVTRARPVSFCLFSFPPFFPFTHPPIYIWISKTLLVLGLLVEQSFMLLVFHLKSRRAEFFFFLKKKTLSKREVLFKYHP